MTDNGGAADIQGDEIKLALKRVCSALSYASRTSKTWINFTVEEVEQIEAALLKAEERER